MTWLDEVREATFVEAMRHMSPGMSEAEAKKILTESHIPAFKKCTCGMEYSLLEWRALPLIGIQEIEGDSDLELRNCAMCRTSLTVEVI